MANLKAPQGCIFFLVIFVIIVAALATRGEAANISTIQWVIAYVEVDGNTSLPDPGPLNEFLSRNTSLVNPLFPKNPPLQLQKCNAILYKTPFDFYTVQHPGGCSRPPRRVKEPERHSLVLTWERVCQITNAAYFGTLVLCLIGRKLCKYSKYLQYADRPARWLGQMLNLSDNSRPTSDVVFICCLMVFFFLMTGLFPGVFLYAFIFGEEHLSPLQLPDPGSMDHVLASIRHNVTLYRCTVGGTFQAYVGFAESCEQLQGCIYPGLVTPSRTKPAHGPGITFLMAAASVTTLAWWIVTVLLVIYYCCFCWPDYVKKGCDWVRDVFKRRRVFNLEMQAPAGSGAV